jgi:hypothetical protein
VPLHQRYQLTERLKAHELGPFGGMSVDSG